MALAKIKKIQLIALRSKKDQVLETLQDTGAFDIIEMEEEDLNKDSDINELQKAELAYANLEFAINLLTPYGKKKSLFAQPPTMTIKEVEEKAKGIDSDGIIKKCTELEETITKATNVISSVQNEHAAYSPWKTLSVKLSNITETDYTKTILGNVKETTYNSLIEKLAKLSELISTETIHKTTVENYIMITFSKDLEREIRSLLSEHKFAEADLPRTEELLKDYLANLDSKAEKAKKEISTSKKELQSLAKDLDNLYIAYDYAGWKKEKLETHKKLGATDFTFVIKAWIPEKSIEPIKNKLNEITKEYEITELKLKKDEAPPVVMQNNNFLSPFESVSKIYGLPKHDELDPTPFLALYFIIFFALCLTDAGYGIVMFTTMALALKFFKLPDGIRKLVKLLMYGGIVTFIIGAVFGGWFGLTPDQVPQSLTYMAANGERMFLFQKINALNSPITVLILALALGFIQVTMGVIMKFVHGLKYGDKKEALLDSGPWVVMLFGIGFYILTMTGVLPETLAPVGKWWVLGAVGLLILTQGRDKKNIIMKLISGALSLYGLVGYMSDILSYSRILALGLATAIIGLAVNIVADLVGGLPYIGWLLMAIVFIGGHIFNLLINALGSFIHSGRLQFVEFFTKFMEGGGDEFRPFSKKSKYIFIKE